MENKEESEKFESRLTGDIKKEMKKVHFNLMIDEDTWESFREYCLQNGFLINRKCGILVEEFIKKVSK
ncbi:hypothetical protein LCGC14_1254810 [marine sediment metagenome]|uniref:Uncharacterized protein n=1 Tax=marine sediment metagenome TaxID=412755 RepID=A0A0F9NJ29_9ZZZZ